MSQFAFNKLIIVFVICYLDRFLVFYLYLYRDNTFQLYINSPHCGRRNFGANSGAGPTRQCRFLNLYYIYHFHTIRKLKSNNQTQTVSSVCTSYSKTMFVWSIRHKSCTRTVINILPISHVSSPSPPKKCINILYKIIACNILLGLFSRWLRWVPTFKIVVKYHNILLWTNFRAYKIWFDSPSCVYVINITYWRKLSNLSITLSEPSLKGCQCSKSNFGYATNSQYIS